MAPSAAGVKLLAQLRPPGGTEAGGHGGMVDQVPDRPAQQFGRPAGTSSPVSPATTMWAPR